MNVLILGRTEILYDTAVLLSENHNICGIITAPAVAEYSRDENDFERLAKDLSCSFSCSTTLGDNELDIINKVSPDVCVSLNWVSLVNDDVISKIHYGVLNAHCGDLPRYRGNAVINWALLEHEPKITLSIHYMTPGELDSGHVLLQKEFDVKNTTTISDILDFWTKSTPDLFADALDGIANKKLKPFDQDGTGKQAFRCFPRLPIHSKIDWTMPAKDIDALIRASTHPYSGAYSYLKINGDIRKVYIWNSSIICDHTHDLGMPGHIIKNDKITGESWIYTGEGILAISSTQYGNGEGEFQPGVEWKSIRMGFGIDVEDELINLISKLNSN